MSYDLDAHLARLPAEVLEALREPKPRARDFRRLRALQLAYANGSARYWTRHIGEPLRRRLLERDTTNPRNDP